MTFEWLPIDQVPDDLKQGEGEELLLCYGNTVYVGYYDLDSAQCGYGPWHTRAGDRIYPTLWCRIPPLPAGKKS